MNPDIRRPQENLLDLRSPHKNPQHPKRKRRVSRNFLRSICVVAVLLLIGLAVLLTHRKKNLDSVLVIKSLVSKHYVLPKNEEPALATITDTSKVHTPFLKQAENGDKILVYQKAQRVIIYRPSIDRIIDIGPVSIADPTGQ